MKKYLIVSTAAILVTIGTAAAWLWHQMGEPLYEPGAVRSGESLRAPLSPPDQPADGDTWRVESDIEIHHFAEGEGRNVLVIHGGPGYPFRSPIAALAPLTDRYRFVYYDQRGCGRSTRPVESFSSSNFYANMTELNAVLGLAAQIADIERIRRILGDEKLILLGHSFGAFLASMYAAEFPERVEAMILVAPADVLVFPVPAGGLFAEIEKRLPDGQQAEYKDFKAEYLDFGGIFSRTESDLQQLNARFATYYLTAAGQLDSPSTAAQEAWAEPGWMVQAMYLSMGKRHDYRAALRAVTAPVLVLHGADDMSPERASRRYADAFQNAAFKLIDNGGHLVFDDQPRAFVEQVEHFLHPRRP